MYTIICHLFRNIKILQIQQDVFSGGQKSRCIVLVLKSSNKFNFGYRNSWSDEGVSTIRVNDIVQCETTHLTSFAVLVDTQGTTATTSTASVIVQQVEHT